MHKEWQIIRQAIHRLRGKPLYATVIVFCLALGIGANTAVFSVVKTLLLNPLLVKDLDRLVSTLDMRNGDDPFGASGVDYVAFKKEATSFSSIGVALPKSFKLVGTERPEHVEGAAISAGYFQTLGINPLVGRSFTPEDDRPGADAVAILSHDIWQRNFGADPKLIGRNVTLANRIYSVIGVMPAGFDLPEGAQVWVPLAIDIETLPLSERLKNSYFLIGRLKAGVSLDQANAEAHNIGVHIEQELPQWRRGWSIKLLPLRQEILGDTTGKVRPVIYLLIFVVCFLLLITCANVANLLLVRSLERGHEVAVQIALGASRRQLMSQLLTESVILALLGGGVGLGLAGLVTKLFTTLKPISPLALRGILDHVDIDGSVLLFTFVISLLTGLLFGLAPMFQSSLSGALVQNLREGGQRGGLSLGGRRLLNVLMVAEIIMAMVLLIGASLMIRNFQQLNNARLGFRKDHLLSVGMYLSTEDYPGYQQRADFVKRLVEHVRTLPGVLSAGVTTNIPLDPISKDATYTVEGKPPVDSSEVPITADRVVTPGYLEMMNIPLLRGRFLNDQDRADTLPVVVVSRELARRAWGDEDPIGKRIRIGYPPDPKKPWYTVVGLVDDVKEDRFNYEIDRAVWYMSYAQRDLNIFPIRLVVLSKDDPASLAPSVRNAVRAINKNQPVSAAVTIDDFLSDFLGPQRFSALLGSIFAGIGLLLAVVGIYSVTSYSVAQRTREFGIRLALGAQRKDLIRIILSAGLRLAGVGLAVGLLCGFVLTRVLSGMLYQAGPAAPEMLVGTVAALGLVAMAAMYMPARRALKVDPSKTLRYE